MSYQHVFTAIDTHTAGEPTRVVVAGVPFLSGATMAEKRRQLWEEHDFVRTTLMHEPRGHADMFGAILTAPAHPKADLGVVFMDTEGYLAMCGHGSLGVVAVALETGLVPRHEPQTEVLMDTPAGLIRAHARVENGRIRQIAIQNVPSFLYRADVELRLPFSDSLRVDIAFGGNFSALVPAEKLGLQVQLTHLPDLVRWGTAIREAANEQLAVVHPTMPHIRAVDLVEIYEDWDGPEAGCRNVVIFGQGQVDRSPCGTGTSAKMAALYASGRLALLQPFISESIIGTRFVGRLLRQEQVADLMAVVPEIAGNAYVTGFQHFVVDADDPLKDGFLLSKGPLT